MKGASRTERATPVTGSQNGHGPAPASRVRVAPPPRPGSRRPLTIGLIVAATALVLIGSLGVLSLRGSDSGQSLADVPGPITPKPAQSFTVLYTVQDSAGPEVKQQTDYLAVKRPYEVRLEHRDGPPPGGAVLTGSIVTQNDTVTLGGSGDGFTIPHPPAVLPGLVSRQALDAAVEGGKAQRRGQSTVLGQKCTHYLYDQFGNDPIGLSDSQAKVDSCITPDDIMLREVIEFGGRTVHTSEAVKLDRSPVFDANAFRPARVVLPDSASQLTDEIIEGPPKGVTKAVAVQAPKGFSRDLAANIGHQVGPDVPPVLYYVQSYTGGGEQLIVEQPLDDSMGSPWSGRGGIKYDIGNGQPTIIIYHSGYVEIETKSGGLPIRVLALRKDLAVYVAQHLKLPA